VTFTNDKAPTYRDGAIFLGVDENSRDIGITTDRHCITAAGSRAGKGVGLIIPNLLRWPHNVLVIDPKGENAENTYQAREKMGQRVYVLDPFQSADIPDRIRAAYNPLANIDITNSRARATILTIANGLVVVHDPKHMEWVTGARTLLAGIIAYVLANAPSGQHTLAQVREILMQQANPVINNEEPEGLYADALLMINDARIGGLIHSAGITLKTAIEADKGMEKDFLGLARRATEWLSDEAISSCLDRSTFDLSELKNGDASVFLVLPADGDFLTEYGAFLRLFVKASINAMGVGQSGKRCLFILDEFSSLGKLEEVSDAAGRMPSYGVHLWPFLQNLGQLRKLYGDDESETFFANADVHIFFGNSDGQTLEYVSKRLGNFTPNEVVQRPPTQEAYNEWKHGSFFKSEKENREIHSTNDENSRRLYQHQMGLVGTPRMPPDQVRELVSKPDGASVAKSMVVFGKGSDVFNLRLAPYFLPPTPEPPPTPPTPTPLDEGKSRISNWKLSLLAVIACLTVVTINLTIPGTLNSGGSFITYVFVFLVIFIVIWAKSAHKD